MTAYVPVHMAQVMWSSHIDRYDRLAMKATLTLNDQILRQAKGRAAQDGVTLTRFVEESLRAKPAAARGRKPAFKLNLKTVSGHRPPNVDISDRDALYDVVDLG